MRRLSVIAVAFSLAAGAGGYVLRCIQLSNAFDTQSGLAISGAASTLRLNILILSFFAAVIIFSVFASVKFKPRDGFEDTFATYSVIYPLILLPVCLLWYYGTVTMFLDFSGMDAMQAADIILIVLSALGATCMIFFAIGIFQNPKHKVLYFLSIVPVVFFCFWLFVHYRDNATNPVLLGFVYQCLAIAACILCFYYIAGVHFGKAVIGKAITAHCAAIFFCAVTIADNLATGMRLIFGSVMIIAAIHLYLLLRSLVRK